MFSREELLGGLPARRASTILFAIENQAVRAVDRSRRALATHEAGRTSGEKERVFLHAVAGGRDQHQRPSIQDLERHAEAWAHLVPDSPDMRAALLQMLGQRVALDPRRTPRLLATLGAGQPATVAAFERLYGRSLEATWRVDAGWLERVRWWRSRFAERLEGLPPFWMAFALTLTETVGGGLLALPIALAGVGVGPGLVLLAVFGLISMVTIAALVEAITRNGSMRYGSAYFGRLVADYLGRPGVIVLTIALLALNALALLIAMTGFGTVLGTATGLAPGIWVAVLFVAILYVLRRESLDATVASALVVGALNLVLLAVLVLLGMAHVQPEHLGHAQVPLLDGVPLDGAVVALVFGVLLAVYFGHTSAANAARIVLRRDPSGRSLLWGNVAAILAAGVIYGAFVVAVNGSVPPERLAAENGTALTPLAEVAGPAVGVIGAAYATLALGIAALYFALGSYNQVVERLSLMGGADARRRWRSVLRRPQVRFLVGASPAIGIFVLMQVLLLLGAESFSGPLNLVGAVTVPLLGGLFPMLMLAAARRRGERVPGTVLSALASPIVIIAVIGIFTAGVLAHALIIWQDPLERLLALLATAVMLWIIVASVRRESFRPRTVIELRWHEPPSHAATLELTADGRRLDAPLTVSTAGSSAVQTSHGGVALIEELETIASLAVHVSAEQPRTMLVWAHHLQPDGSSEPQAVQVSIDGRAQATERGRLETILPEGEVTVTLKLADIAPPAANEPG